MAVVDGTSARDRRFAALRASTDRLLELGGVAGIASHQRVRLEHGDIHHLEAGTGSTVVLLHGAGGGGANWYRVLGPLAARYRVLAPDLPGFAESAPAEASRPLGRVAARLLCDWLDAVARPPWVLVGTSFGGLAALRMVQARAAQVRGLVLLDAVGLGASAPVLVRLAAMRPLTRLLLTPSRAGTDLLFRLILTSDRRHIPAAHRACLVDYLWRSSAAGGAAQLMAALPDFANRRGQREVLEDAELTAVAVPTLVAWGGRDRFVPVEHARRAARVIPGAELRVMERAGHSPNWESPDELVAILLDFIARLAP